MTLLIFMVSIGIAPIAEAVQHHDSKTPVGSVLRSDAWARMPLALRESAQFSAGVESARVLHRIQGGLGKLLSHDRTGDVLTDRSGLIRDIVQIAVSEGLTPSDPSLRGTIQDITSEARAELIVNTQTAKAYGFSNWKTGQDEDALDAAPAQELVRIRDAREPRDWQRRWVRAGGTLRDGRMIALKGDPVWTKISRFGTPYPPYDFGSGMWVEDVLRDEAIKLGLLAPGQVVPPDEQDFNAKLESSVAGLSPQLKQALTSLFGPQVEVDGDAVKWKANQSRAYEQSSISIRQEAQQRFRGGQEALVALQSGDDGAQVLGGIQTESARANAVEISAVAVGRKPVFHEDWGQVPPEQLERFVDQLQRQLPHGVFARHESGHVYVWHGDLASRFLKPNEPQFPQIRRLTLSGENGFILGFGQKTLNAKDSVIVLIQDSGGNAVSGFRTQRSSAELYGAARARDWRDATGTTHTYSIIEIGGRP